MKDKIELKPCPFCGANAEIVTSVEDLDHEEVCPGTQIRCVNCGNGTDVFVDINYDGSAFFNAIYAWNHRVSDKEKDPCSAGTEQESGAAEATK